MDDEGSVKIPTFSLVFLTWNSEDVIERTIDSVLAQTYSDFEIVIVDNDSKDRTIPIVRNVYGSDERVSIVENDSNLGFTRGINRGIEQTQGKYICCYNDDTHFPEDYLETLATFVSPDTVWTTARINYRVSSTDRTVRLLTGHRFPIPYVVNELRGVAKVNYVPGDGLIVPRKIYENELDELVFNPAMLDKGEDMDLSLRLRDDDIPLKAILDTYSIHPDEGFYDPGIGNAIRHVRNVYARYQAYRQNGFGIVPLASVLVSTISVPLEIFFGPFPRDTAKFRERTMVEERIKNE